VTLLRIQLLGQFGLIHGAEPITAVNTPRFQSLLAYLVLHADRPQPRQRLASLFWPDSNEPQARTNLRQLLHHLRSALPEPDSFLETDMATLRWRPDAPFSLDVAEFRSAADRGALEEAAGQYGGDLLPGLDDEWIEPLREELHRRFGVVLEHLVTWLEGKAKLAEAISFGERLVRHDPVREESYRQLMRLYASMEAEAKAFDAPFGS